MPNQFDATEIEALKYYVYVYSDPRNGRPFYIGKGIGNRAFAHLNDTGESAKAARIRELDQIGLEPTIEILAFGLDETTAYKVEAAAIDLIGFDNLTNRVVGHGANRFGRMVVDEVHGKLSSTPIEAFEDSCVLIRIRDSWADSSKQSALSLYDATRGTWKVSRANAERVRYALAVYAGVVREVYEIAAWFTGGSTMYADPERDATPIDRFEFVGRIAPDPVRSRYRWKSVAHYFKPGAANPIMYVGPHRQPFAAIDEARSDEPETAARDVDDAVIVAARYGYKEYLETAAYICQPDRYFRDSVTHLGFYTDGEIKREIARILYAEESVIFTPDEARRRESSRHDDVRRVGQLMRRSLASASRPAGAARKVMLLSAPSDERTLNLERPIINDTVAASGRKWAWTLGQRYASLTSLKSGARVTSELSSIGSDDLSVENVAGEIEDAE